MASSKPGTKFSKSRDLPASVQKSLKLAVSNKLAIVNSFASDSSDCWSQSKNRKYLNGKAVRKMERN